MVVTSSYIYVANTQLEPALSPYVTRSVGVSVIGIANCSDLFGMSEQPGIITGRSRNIETTESVLVSVSDAVYYARFDCCLMVMMNNEIIVI